MLRFTSMLLEDQYLLEAYYNYRILDKSLQMVEWQLKTIYLQQSSWGCFYCLQIQGDPKGPVLCALLIFLIFGVCYDFFFLFLSLPSKASFQFPNSFIATMIDQSFIIWRACNLPLQIYYSFPFFCHVYHRYILPNSKIYSDFPFTILCLIPPIKVISMSSTFCKTEGVHILTKMRTKKPRSYEIAKQIIKFSSDLLLLFFSAFR